MFSAMMLSRFIRRFVIFIVFLCLFGCGGGGGSSGADSTSGNSQTGTSQNGFDPTQVSEADLVKIFPKPSDRKDGHTLEILSNTFLLALDTDIYQFPSPKIGGEGYNASRVQTGQGTLTLLAMQNADVYALTGVDRKNDGENTYFIVFTGQAPTSLPTQQVYYSGQYVALDRNGQIQGQWPMEVFMDFNNMTNSFGINIGDKQEIRIRFQDMNGTMISGTISDLNHDYNLSTFEFFGNNGNTLTGGYSGEIGAGLLLVSRDGSPP